MLPADVKVLKQSEDASFVDGQTVRTIKVQFKVGTHGPFQVSVPKDGFTADLRDAAINKTRRSGAHLVNGIRPVRRLTVIERCGLWLALALLLYLDRHAVGGVVHADVFSWLIAAFGFLEDVGNVIIGGIEVAISTAVGWLVSAVTWLGGKIVDIVMSTGTIFSKTWDALEGLWTDVIKPGLAWLADTVERFASWLKDFIQPLLDWAKTIRDYVLEIYKDFIKPILDALAIAKGILDILTALHVPFAATLDGYVQDLGVVDYEGVSRRAR